MAIDVARALAILGMLAVHVGPTDNDGIAGVLYATPHGRASILFVLIAGIGTTLLAGSPNRGPKATRLTLLWRASLLLPLGLVLQELEHGAAVILQDYAIFFLVAILVIGWSDRLILTLTAISVTVGPALFLWGQITAPHVYDRDVTAITDPIGSIVHGLILSGPYPLITWVAPFLFGIWIGRRDLRSVSLHRWLAYGGLGVALGGIGVVAVLHRTIGPPSEAGSAYQLLAIAPHSQMIVWLVSGTGVAAAVLGFCLLVVPSAERLFWPLTTAGQLALTVYVGHLVILHLAPDALTSDDVGEASLILVGFTAVILVLTTAWRAWYDRGPLEAGLRVPWDLFARLGSAD